MAARFVAMLYLALAAADHCNPSWSMHVSTYFTSSPAVGADGAIFAGYQSGSDGEPRAGGLIAVDASGRVLWDVKTDKPWCGVQSFHPSSPSIGLNGTIFGSDQGSLYSIDVRSREILAKVPRAPLAAWSRPAVGIDGTVYEIMSQLTKRFVVGLNPVNLTVLHTSSESGISGGSPVVGFDGTVFVGAIIRSSGVSLLAMNPDLTTRWKCKVSNVTSVTLGPLVVTLDRVYFPSSDGRVHVVSTGGSLLQSMAVNASMLVPLSVDEHGVVFAVGSQERGIDVIDGSSVQRFNNGSFSTGVPAARDGAVFSVVTENNLVIAKSLSADGYVAWACDLGAYHASSFAAAGNVALGSRNSLVITTSDGAVVCLNLSSGEPLPILPGAAMDEAAGRTLAALVVVLGAVGAAWLSHRACTRPWRGPSQWCAAGRRSRTRHVGTPPRSPRALLDSRAPAEGSAISM
mmetsp:Transcript_39465/g.96909  ORF Transcript_39465/g.96909 Transcript_39465/m.96909 type:complete len:459 (-) Transcript_39465:132-1508(-)